MACNLYTKKISAGAKGVEAKLREEEAELSDFHVGRVDYNQWFFQVPLTGGRDYITP